jgi:hypothetical protein
VDGIDPLLSGDAILERQGALHWIGSDSRSSDKQK